MYKIIARSRYGVETIDTADTREEALYLANEYRIAYGYEFSISIKKSSKN